MRALGIIALCVVVLIVGAVIWYMSAYPTYTYRFRLSIAVDVGGEIRTASSVIEVRTVTRPMAVLFSPIERHIYGDAVFLDLGARGNIIALLGCDPDGTQDCLGTIVLEKFGVVGLENMPHLETLRGSRELTSEIMPTFVTFDDLANPKSARVVRPDQFEQMLASDVYFNRAWIEMTTDSVTRGIEKKLPWWDRPGRPAAEAYRAWLKGKTDGPSIEPETRFKRD